MSVKMKKLTCRTRQKCVNETKVFNHFSRYKMSVIKLHHV